MERYCYTRHVQDLFFDGKTPFERRIGEPSKGPVISFRSKFEYHPISAKDQSRIHQFGKEVLPGIGPVLEVKNVCHLDVEVVIPPHLGMLPILGLYDPEAQTAMWTSYNTMIQIIHQNALKKADYESIAETHAEQPTTQSRAQCRQSEDHIPTDKKGMD